MPTYIETNGGRMTLIVGDDLELSVSARTDGRVCEAGFDEVGPYLLTVSEDDARGVAGELAAWGVREATFRGPLVRFPGASAIALDGVRP